MIRLLLSLGHGFACQMSVADSAMVRSLENFPELARNLAKAFPSHLLLNDGRRTDSLRV